MTHTKAAIIDKIYNQCGFSKSKSIQVTEKLLEIIKSILEKGEDVLISGFGKFYVLDKKKRKGRNPQTGEDLTLDQRRVVVFKCSGRLREKMNKK